MMLCLEFLLPAEPFTLSVMLCVSRAVGRDSWEEDLSLNVHMANSVRFKCRCPHHGKPLRAATIESVHSSDSLCSAPPASGRFPCQYSCAPSPPRCFAYPTDMSPSKSSWKVFFYAVCICMLKHHPQARGPAAKRVPRR